MTRRATPPLIALLLAACSLQFVGVGNTPSSEWRSIQSLAGLPDGIDAASPPELIALVQYRRSTPVHEALKPVRAFVEAAAEEVTSTIYDESLQEVAQDTTEQVLEALAAAQEVSLIVAAPAVAPTTSEDVDRLPSVTCVAVRATFDTGSPALQVPSNALQQREDLRLSVSGETLFVSTPGCDQFESTKDAAAVASLVGTMTSPSTALTLLLQPRHPSLHDPFLWTELEGRLRSHLKQIATPEEVTTTMKYLDLALGYIRSLRITSVLRDATLLSWTWSVDAAGEWDLAWYGTAKSESAVNTLNDVWMGNATSHTLLYTNGVQESPPYNAMSMGVGVDRAITVQQHIKKPDVSILLNGPLGTMALTSASLGVTTWYQARASAYAYSQEVASANAEAQETITTLTAAVEAYKKEHAGKVPTPAKPGELVGDPAGDASLFPTYLAKVPTSIVPEDDSWRLRIGYCYGWLESDASQFWIGTGRQYAGWHQTSDERTIAAGTTPPFDTAPETYHFYDLSPAGCTQLSAPGWRFIAIQPADEGWVDTPTEIITPEPTPDPAYQDERVDVQAGTAPFLGDDEAPVTIIEFTDYQCPFCQRAHKDILPQLRKEYIDSKLVRFTIRNYPLPFHTEARVAAEAAACANAQQKFWEMSDALFTADDLTAPALKGLAKELGLDTKKFATCLDTSATAKQVDDDLAAAGAAGVSGTPTFFINGKRVVGAVPFEQIKQVVDAEVKAAQR